MSSIKLNRSTGLGFTHENGSCAAIFSNIFRKMGVKLLEKKLSPWAESVLRAIDDSQEDGISAELSGYSRRGQLSTEPGNEA